MGALATKLTLDPSLFGTPDGDAELEAITRSNNLEQLTRIVRNSKRTFLEVGWALWRIRDARLYKLTHSSWEKWIEDNWWGTKRQADRSIRATLTAAESGLGKNIPTESVAIELARVPADHRPQLMLALGPDATGEEARTVVDRHLGVNRPMLAREAYTQSESNEHYTPAVYVDAARKTMGGIDLDPASCAEANKTVKAKRILTIKDNGLKKRWRGRVWMNNPYGWLTPELTPWEGKGTGERVASSPLWLAKLVKEVASKRVTQACALFNCVPGDGWWQPLWDRPLCFPYERISFVEPGGEAQGGNLRASVIAYFGPKSGEKRFAKAFGELGRIVVPRGSLSMALAESAA